MSADLAAAPGPAPGDSPRALWRDDLVAGLTGVLLILGLFIDGWNHLNLQNGKAGDFLTPWHGVLYAGFNACAIWAITRNPRLRGMLFPSRAKKSGAGAGAAARPAVNPMQLALLGMGLVALGLVGDGMTNSGGGAMQPPFDYLLFTGAAVTFAVGLRLALARFDIDRRVAVPAALAVGAAAAAFFAFGSKSVTTTPSAPAHDVARVAETPGVAEVSSAPAVLSARAHAPARVKRAAAVHRARHTRVAQHRAASAAATTGALAVATTPSALPTTHEHGASSPVAVRRVSRPVSHAPARRHAAAPAPATKQAHHVWTNVAVPDVPAPTSQSVTTSTSTSTSNPDTPAPATAAKPSSSPTAAPSPAANPTPASPASGGPGPH